MKHASKGLGRTTKLLTITAAITLGMVLPGLASAQTQFGDQHIRSLLNTAVSYHYHKTIKRKTTDAACYFDPDNASTMRCSWTWNDPGANAQSMRRKTTRDAKKWCKNAGGKSCTVLYRNGKLRYDGLPPEQEQAIKEVLENIPLHSREASPLPEGATIKAGLFHERFVQKIVYAEDWRNKKAAKRHYAMCANEQGSGADFLMQGRTRQLSQIREMCVIQCQAVAQWENTQGRCYTIYENGQFTGKAAKHAMRLEFVAAGSAIRDAFVGAWKGTDHRGTTTEAIIKNVHTSGNAEGSACMEFYNGALLWAPFNAAPFLNADRIALSTGGVRRTMMLSGTHGEPTELVTTSSSGWQTRIAMDRFDKGSCHDRFRTTATVEEPAQRQTDDAPIAGTWSARWENGTILELAIESIGAKGAVHGRYCTMVTSGRINMWDLSPEGTFTGTVDKKGKKAKVKIPWGNDGRDELELRLKKDDTVTMKLKKIGGSQKQKPTTTPMVRGAAEDGCLRRTTRRPTGDKA